MNSGCPLSRHELTDNEWLALGAVKAEMERIRIEEMKEEEGK